MHAPGDLVLLDDLRALNDRWNHRPALVVHRAAGWCTLIDGTGAPCRVQARIVDTYFVLLSKAT